MSNVYNDPDYVGVRQTMHERLEKIRRLYGDSDANNQKFIDLYHSQQLKGNSVFLTTVT